MKMRVEPQDILQDAVPSSRLFRDWLAGDLKPAFLDPSGRDAGSELKRALDYVGEPAPLFRSAWVAGWAAEMRADLAGTRDRDVFQGQLTALTAGEAGVVVTGQQPGFLGGPLYTLYKVATVIALAQARSAAGRPTVPVFWSGDDDDDLAEALGPVYWDPGMPGLKEISAGIKGGPGGRSPMIGRLTGTRWSAEAARWLAQVSVSTSRGPESLAADLAAIWNEAEAEEWPWSRLSRRALLRVFAGCGLVIVSGDDPGLHAAAGPLYEKILPRGEELAELAAERGRLLTSGGWHAQIAARSLARPLFTTVGDRRAPLEASLTATDPATLRPGVMLRSPIQDWLLRPAAVVAGPGELAYLRQLDPVYGELGVPRPPLVPRLFSWLVPPGFDTGELRVFRERGSTDPELAARLADRAEEEARHILADILTEQLGVDPQRSAALAEGRARRWRKGVAAMLKDEIERSRQAAEPAGPEWVFPAGRRQERHLAYGCAAALWGNDLVTACLEAAARHLEHGLQSDWREFTIEVPEP